MACSVRAKTRTGALGQGPLYNRKQGGGAEFHAPPFLDMENSWIIMS